MKLAYTLEFEVENDRSVWSKRDQEGRATFFKRALRSAVMAATMNEVLKFMQSSGLCVNGVYVSDPVFDGETEVAR